MAGPQFFTPKSVKPSRPRRRFTLDEANKTLPLVRRVVGDIVTTHTQAVTLQKELEQVATKEQPAVQGKLDIAMSHLEDYVDELREIGCELKDYQQGLIDFTGRHKGRDICFCWKLGEETVAHWHETSAGVAGRQPVSTLNEAE
jgi:hypothetical protein